MRVACPECTTPIEANAGEEVVCPACMTRFAAPDSLQVPRRFDVHLPDGTQLPRLSVFAVREAIYTGRIPITSRMRPDVGADDLVAIYNYPPFGQVFLLLGIEPPTTAGTRKIAGWQGTRQEQPVAPRTVSMPAIPVEEQARRFLKTASLPLLLGLGVAAFMAVLLGIAIILAL